MACHDSWQPQTNVMSVKAETRAMQSTPTMCRFIRNQLVVEITSSAQTAHLFGWALKKHTILAFFLYTAGAVSELPDWLHGTRPSALTCRSELH